MSHPSLGAPLGACDKATVDNPLEAELDRLFQLPPGELVAARNALADALRRAGDKTSAARVKAIKRATPIAWALNQVHFRYPEVLEQAREHTRELRALQTQRGLDARQLARAVERQRSAVQAVVDSALRAGRSAGLSDAVLQPRKLFTTVQAWLAGKSGEAPGRMTAELEASGFDAFAGVALTDAPVTALQTDQAPSAGLLSRSEQAVIDHAALDEAARALREHEQRALAAHERVQVCAAEQAAAEQAHARAAISLREAERQLTALRAALEQRASSVERHTIALTDARARAEQADAAVTAARAELARRGAAGGMVPAMPDFSLFGDEHVRKYEATNGQTGHAWNGAKILILRTKGRSTGELRKAPLIYGRDGDDYLIVASKGGAPEHPGWYKNLLAQPDVEIQVLGDVLPVRARTASAQEKARLWPVMTTEWPPYDTYQSATSRDIPLVILSKR